MVRRPKSSLPTIYLIRHGETAWSLSGQHTGRTDIPLTAHGEHMARELAPLLASVNFAAVLTSPSQRARRTCELAAPGAAAIVDPDLAEWDYGDFDGMATDEIWQDNPGWNVFRDGCPGGETLEHVIARADCVLARLKTWVGPIALFSHGQFGCVLAARWAGLGAAAGEHFNLNPASISILGPKSGHPEVPAIVRWNVVPEARLVEHIQV